MCGIFGFVISNKCNYREEQIEDLIRKLFILSESRGKEAAGLAVAQRDSIDILKSPVSASEFIRTLEFGQFLKRTLAQPSTDRDREQSLVVIGHSRMVTNGEHQVHNNNQPALANGLAAIHNGIITNHEHLWKENPTLQKETELDTEIFLKILKGELEKDPSYARALRTVYEKIEGVASVAILSSDTDDLLIATNNGSLYFCENPDTGFFLFSSERYILKRTFESLRWLNRLLPPSPQHLLPGQANVISFDGYHSVHFAFSEGQPGKDAKPADKSRQIRDFSPQFQAILEVEHTLGKGGYLLPSSFLDAFPKAAEAVSCLRRCTRCILPETMPFIDFDDDGVCNYCRYEEVYQPLGLDALEEAVAPYRKSDGGPDCLVTFSGGRDSSFGVHFVTKVLKMKPVTYSYDWGMITDLGRRNQMRMCGKLGLENILVSADLAKKRRNIRLNINAWLKQPDLGTVPLFMAGDKQYFYYANLVGQQTGSKIIILCENPMETTRFKSGYCGISPHFGGPNTYSLRLSDKFRLLKYYGSRFLANPAYINASLIDSLKAYLSYYFLPHHYLNLFQYIPWDETVINNTLKTYNWETASDTKSTWRIGDGTASFYNYIYYMMAGFTENDTFRSNQIRAGMINREEALAMVNEENVPRYASIQWYCDVIGIDFESTINIINQAPKRYKFE